MIMTMNMTMNKLHKYTFKSKMMWSIICQWKHEKSASNIEITIVCVQFTNQYSSKMCGGDATKTAAINQYVLVNDV